MRGYFDEDEPEAEQPRRDREVTLGAGAVLGLCLGLLLLCGLCVGVGYAIGHRGSGPAAAGAGSTAAPDQEPLQSNGAIPKPSAAETEPAAPAPGDSTTTAGDGAGANPSAAQPGAGASGQSGAPNGSGPGAAAGTNTGQVQPALPSAGGASPAAQGGSAPNVQAALPSQPQWMVQIAAVLHSEDADVLAAALRKRGYAVSEARESADGLIHVKIGPFNSRDDAVRWQNKLLGDGYNAQVQP